jgi:hypothetical protein
VRRPTKIGPLRYVSIKAASPCFRARQYPMENLSPRFGAMKKSGAGGRLTFPCALSPYRHVNVPSIAPPPKHLLVIDAKKLIAVPELVGRVVCYDARRGGNVFFAPGPPGHRRNRFSLIDPGYLFGDFGGRPLARRHRWTRPPSALSPCRHLH